MPEYVSREQFLAAKKLATRDVTVPEIGLVRVREPSRMEWDEFDKQGDHYGVRLLVAFAVDAKGGRLFKDEDVTRLLQIGTGKIESVAWAIFDLAGLTPAAQEALAKNSGTTPTPASDSD